MAEVGGLARNVGPQPPAASVSSSARSASKGGKSSAPSTSSPILGKSRRPRIDPEGLAVISELGLDVGGLSG